MSLDYLLEENKPLAPFTTLGIGGPARWFIEATREDEIAEAAAWAGERGIPLFVLGGGSNLVVSDGGFNGLVLRVDLRGISGDDGSHGRLKRIFRVAAGEDWDWFVQRSVEENCAGIECLAGIPGTVGGTPVQNVGAYGQEVASTIDRVRAFDLCDQAWVEFSAAECGFAYRRSRFNSIDPGRYVVTRVNYRLIPGGAPTLRYADVQRALGTNAQPSLADVAQAVRRIRQSKGMLLVDGDPDCRSVGSFFKNPVVKKEQAECIQEKSGKELPRFSAGTGDEEMVKIPAAWLIEQAGFVRGYVLGGVGISSRHTLALINRGGAKAAEVLALAEEIKTAVQARFGIELEREPVLVGFESNVP
jgi:UDP-N-acetylmuramate dehydrogenase